MQGTTMTTMVAEAQVAERLAEAARHRTAASTGRPEATAVRHEPAVTIRFAREHEREQLDRLGELEGRGDGWADRAGDALLAEVDGAVVAALATSGDVVADPFRDTAAIVRLLRLRAEQLARANGRNGSFRERLQTRPVF